jgi:hypothetical protein
MRALAICAVIAAASAGCLRSPEFRCQRDGECGAGGVCESVGYCSSPNASCPGTGRAYGDSAGSISNSCVPTANPGPGRDAGIEDDAAIDARIIDARIIDAQIDGPAAACAAGYAPVGGSPHLYKRITDSSWDTAARDCKLTGNVAYLAIPDDAGELADIVSVATTPPVWIGIDDKQQRGAFVTQKGAQAQFLPWDEGEPNQDPPAKDCVVAVSSSKIATDRCGNTHAVVCECEP